MLSVHELFRAAALLAAIFILPGNASATGPDNGAVRADAAIYASISGSPWPGVIDHLLEQPAPGESRGSGPAIHISYPSFGRPDIDGDIREWVSGLAEAFATHLDMDSAFLRDATPAGQGDDAETGDDGNAQKDFELWGSYEVSWPSRNAVSITFELWNYTGSPQGNMDILTLNYSLLSGQRLGLVDIFDDPDLALELMSQFARQELEKRLGGNAWQMRDGTAPLVENYSSLGLRPDGLRINFQPFQVAGWNAGAQHVDVPLEWLMPAGPMLELWAR